MELPKDIKRIIVRCPNWVGDIVMATVVFEGLRASFPDAQIACLIRGYASKMVCESPWFDRIISIDDKSKAGRKQQVKDIREFAPDIAIVLPNSWSSILPIWRAGCRRIYGYRRNGRSIILKDGPSPIREKGKIKAIATTEYYAELGRYLGLAMPAVIQPRLYISDELEHRAKKIFTKYNILADDMVVGLNPGASFGSSKCWPTEYYARLAEILEKHYCCRLLMFTAPGEEQIAQEIMAQTDASIIDMRHEGLDLDLLKPLIKRCGLLVTNDTGPRHYAVAFDVPVAVIFGSTDPGLTASNLEKTATIRLELECSPCQQKICPLGHHRCMKELMPDMVFQQIRELVK